MSAQSETVRVKTSPEIRLWQALLVAAALVAGLLLVLGLGRASAPAGVANTFDPRDFTAYMCTGHVPNPACELKVAGGSGDTAHVPPGGLERDGEGPSRCTSQRFSSRISSSRKEWSCVPIRNSG